MRAARCTTYPTWEPEHCLHVVVAEPSVAVPFGAFLDEARDAPPGAAYVVVDEFEADAEGVELVEQALRRWRERLRREADAAMCYHWYARALSRLVEGGTVSATLPAPLSTGELREVLRQLVRHPSYRRQTVALISEDGELVMARGGRVT